MATTMTSAHQEQQKGDSSDPDIGSWTTAELLRALDERSIRYAATSTRRDLEELLQRNHPHQGAPPNDEWRRRYERRCSRRKREVQKNHIDQILNPVASLSSGVFSAGYRRARRLKRHVSDAWAVDPTTGVRTVRYSKRPTTTGRKEPLTTSRKRVKNDVSGRGTIDVGFTDGEKPRRTSRSRRPRQRSEPPGSRNPVLVTPPSNTTTTAANEPTEASTDIVLASTYDTKQPRHAAKQRRQRAQPRSSSPPRQSSRHQRRRRHRDPSKPVYSPYPAESNSSPSAPEDIVASWMSQAADKVWGATSTSSSSEQQQQQQPHWKDRWEERFDKLLGLEEEEEQAEAPYRRWTRAEEQEPRRRRHRTNNSNLVSLIMGRANSRSVSLDHLLENVWESGSVLSLFKLVLWTAAKYYGQACRWACVRGALPQPAVALFISAVGISVRRRRLLWAAMTLLVFRALGEAVSQSPSSSSWSYQDDDDDTESSDFDIRSESTGDETSDGSSSTDDAWDGSEL